MQFLFNEEYLPSKGLFQNSLSAVFGVGVQRSKILHSVIGLNQSIKVKKLSKYRYSIVSALIKKYLLVDTALRRVRYTKQKAFLSFNRYRSLKYRAFLPIRGQSTRTNAKTSKKRRSKQIKK